jgi:hypothetical protein
MDALDVGFKAYAVWLLQHGGVCPTDRISMESTLLETVMKSLSEELIGFFFSGCHSRKDGAPFLPAEYNALGGSAVLQLFFRANNDLAEVDQVRFFQCYGYLLRTYPAAALPTNIFFFKVLIRCGVHERRHPDDMDGILREHWHRLYCDDMPPLFPSSTTLAHPISGQDLTALLEFAPGVYFPHKDFHMTHDIWSEVLGFALYVGLLWYSDTLSTLYRSRWDLMFPGPSDGPMGDTFRASFLLDHAYAVIVIIPAICFTIVLNNRAWIRLQNGCSPLLRFGHLHDGSVIFLIMASLLPLVSLLSLSILAGIKVAIILNRTAFSAQWLEFIFALVIFFAIPGFLLDQLFREFDPDSPEKIWRGARAQETKPDSTKGSWSTYLCKGAWKKLLSLCSVKSTIREDGAVYATSHVIPTNHEDHLRLEDQGLLDYDETLKQMEVEDEAVAGGTKKKTGGGDRRRVLMERTAKALTKLGRLVISPFVATIVLGDWWGREVETMNRRRQAAQRAMMYRYSEFGESDMLLQ